MNEQDYETLMRDAASRYHVPPERPPLDAIWRRVESAAFGPAPIPIPVSRRRWLAPLALAATLLFGVGIGFGIASLTQRDAIAALPVAAVPTERAVPDTPSPFVGVAGDYVERATALLTTIGDDAAAMDVSPGTIRRAQDLLSTTRLVLDAGVADRALRDLLEDLELVLAQIVRLPEHRAATDAQLITEALDQRDVLSRLTLLLSDSRGP